MPRAHFPGLEGLRALAAVMVVVHHCVNLSWPRANGLPVHQVPLAARLPHVSDGGVAIFFVLSGFLIYRPFAAAHLAGRSAMPAGRFWWRRLLRIVPAYWLALTFFWLLGNYSFTSIGNAARYYFFLQIYSKETVLGGIVPAWSLNTEVSFYLVVPLVAAALAVLGRRRSVGQRLAIELGAVGLLIASAYAFRAWVSAIDPSWRGLAFEWLPGNLDLFGVGMLLGVLSAWATAHPDRAAWTARLGRRPELNVVVAALIFGWFAVFIGPADFVTGYQGGYWQLRQTVMWLVAGLLLLPSVFGPTEGGPWRAFLRLRPVVWVGMVSYGLYLWHLPWLDRLVDRQDGFGNVLWRGWLSGPVHLPEALVWAFGMGLGCAALSWYLLEKPLQRFKTLF